MFAEKRFIPIKTWQEWRLTVNEGKEREAQKWDDSGI
jgi:hypothetical protein